MAEHVCGRCTLGLNNIQNRYCVNANGVYIGGTWQIRLNRVATQPDFTGMSRFLAHLSRVLAGPLSGCPCPDFLYFYGCQKDLVLGYGQILLRYPGRRPGRRPAASWNLAYHALSSSLAAS